MKAMQVQHRVQVAGLRQKANQLRRQLEARSEEEQIETIQLQHLAQVAEMKQEASQLRRQLEARSQDVQFLNERLRNHLDLETELNDLRREKLNLAREQEVAKAKYQERHVKRKQRAYADAKLTIRHFGPSVLKDPKGEVMKILKRLDVNCAPEQVEIITCAPMAANPDQ